MPDNKGHLITYGWISTFYRMRVHIYIYIYIYIYEMDLIMHHATSELTAELP